MNRERAPEDLTLEAWDRLRSAIQCVQCALPEKMTEAIRALAGETRQFDNLMRGRAALSGPRP